VKYLIFYFMFLARCSGFVGLEQNEVRGTGVARATSETRICTVSIRSFEG